jgi:hypothetical protein
MRVVARVLPHAKSIRIMHLGMGQRARARPQLGIPTNVSRCGGGVGFCFLKIWLTRWRLILL